MNKNTPTYLLNAIERGQTILKDVELFVDGMNQLTEMLPDNEDATPLLQEAYRLLMKAVCYIREDSLRSVLINRQLEFVNEQNTCLMAEVARLKSENNTLKYRLKTERKPTFPTVVAPADHLRVSHHLLTSTLPHLINKLDTNKDSLLYRALVDSKDELQYYVTKLKLLQECLIKKTNTHTTTPA